MKYQQDVFAHCCTKIDVTCVNLGLRPAFSLTSFIEALESFRKRRIFLFETTTMPHSHTAMTIWTPQHDAICYRAGFGLDHQLLTIGHELGHLISDHTRKELPPHLLEEYPKLQPIAQHGQIYICGRTVYDNPDELEAEYMATYLTSLIMPSDDALVNSILQL